MKILSITSGKGGVGKTSIVANMATRLAQLGRRVLILDGDLGMANVDIAFGVRAEFSIQNVLSGEKKLKEILIEVGKNIFLLPGGSGIAEFNNINFFHRQALVDSACELSFDFDYLLIDTAPGIGDNVLYLNSAADQVLVVITPDPTSFTDAYALIKVLNNIYKTNRFKIICNQVKDRDEGIKLFHRFNEVVSRFTHIGLSYLGSLPLDQDLRSHNRQQRLVMRQMPGSQFAQALCNITEELDSFQIHYRHKQRLNKFWEQVVGQA